MNKTIDILTQRGFVSQCTDVNALSALMDTQPVTFYLGVDPTGASLHIGHMVPFFGFRHLTAGGNPGIALMGDGTARIGDPSGKSETRKILSYETLDANAALIQGQLKEFLGGFDGRINIVAHNKDWLAPLNYIDFLREIGRHFSVNHMLSFEAYKKRLETGLSFIEFNYQLLQSYDFLELYRRYGCRMQIGGDDQWGNITAGMELIRRIEGVQAFGLTFPLVTTSDGKKMGKTEKGALFLDPDITSVYDFFQYWRNVTDADVRRFLLMFTFLSVDEVDAVTAPGKNPNEGKERLAWEITALLHGKTEADKAMSGAKAAFGGGSDRDAMPTVKAPRASFDTGLSAVNHFVETGLCPTKSEARRLIEQGGALVSDAAGVMTTLGGVNAVVNSSALDAAGELVLRAGKKRYCRIVTR
jgi:tyrosyl-tRNA synthetase